MIDGYIHTYKPVAFTLRLPDPSCYFVDVDLFDWIAKPSESLKESADPKFLTHSRFCKVYLFMKFYFSFFF
jgi:hypothetical protein